MKRRCLESSSGGTLVASRREIRAQHELALESAVFETSVRLDNFIQRDPLGDARLDRGTGQQSEKALQVLPEPLRMLQPHRVDGVEKARLPPGNHLQRYRRAIHINTVSMPR